MKKFVIERSVDWIYCDPAGIMFYPEYYIWFDQGTERLFSANGLTYEYVGKQYNLVGYPLVESGAKFTNPCRHGEVVDQHSELMEWSGKTFLMQHRIIHKDGRIALEGFERRVWAVRDPAAPKGMRAQPVPEEVMARFVD